MNIVSKLLVSLTVLPVPLLAASDSLAQPKENVEPLSEEFLLFLAEMEEVDGQLVHALDVIESNTENLLADSDVENAEQEVATESKVAAKVKGKKDEEL